MFDRIGLLGNPPKALFGVWDHSQDVWLDSVGPPAWCLALSEESCRVLQRGGSGDASGGSLVGFEFGSR